MRPSRLIPRAASILFAAATLCAASPVRADDALNSKVESRLAALQPRIIEWRRDFHQNPELSNREFRTSKMVAEHLKRIGLEVQTGIAKTVQWYLDNQAWVADVQSGSYANWVETNYFNREGQQ